ncbi:MAG: type II toxin-antitoxin system RelE/ParE family toxin [Methanomicrobiaceae archaeon]|nr:type II toxin-antitoxin system RelE/ParE family toxin [Methanomicrobiaceae archaeon]
MRFTLLIRRELVDFLNTLDDKSRRIIRTKLAALEEDPYPGTGDKERLHLPDDTLLYRMHIGRSWTVFYRVDEPGALVKIMDIMTIEQAHKRYGRW